METVEKIGIIGGTFNPIHIGHLILAETAREVFGLSKVLFMPSSVSYLKDQSTILSANERAEMTRLAIEGNSHFELSLLEVNRGGNSYTYETLKKIKEQNPKTEFYFILGADSLFAIETWAKPEQIFSKAVILAASREDHTTLELLQKIEYLRKKYNADIRLLSSKMLDVSSSVIRKKIALGESVRYFVPDKVLSYIQEHHLYEKK